MINLYKALLNSQGEFPKLVKDAKNPHYKSSYASLPNVLDTVVPVLQKHGLFITSKEIAINDMPYMQVQVIHAESGEIMESNVKLFNVTDMQKLGSAYTYAIRYAILAMLGLAPDDDDDGNAASLNNKPPVKTPPKQPAVKLMSVEELLKLAEVKKEVLGDGYLKCTSAIKTGEKLPDIQNYLVKL